MAAAVTRSYVACSLVPTHSPAAGCCRPVRGSSWSLGVAGRRLSSASGTSPVEECECWQVPRLVPKLCRALLCRAFPRTGRLVARARISTASMRPLAATGERRARRMTAPASAGCTKMERGQEKKWASGEARGLRGAAGPRQQGPNMFCVPGRKRCASLCPRAVDGPPETNLWTDRYHACRARAPIQACTSEAEGM